MLTSRRSPRLGALGRLIKVMCVGHSHNQHVHIVGHRPRGPLVARSPRAEEVGLTNARDSRELALQHR